MRCIYHETNGVSIKTTKTGMHILFETPLTRRWADAVASLREQFPEVVLSFVDGLPLPSLKARGILNASLLKKMSGRGGSMWAGGP